MRPSHGRVRRRLTLWYAGSLALIWVLFALCVCVYVCASGNYLLKARADQEFAHKAQALGAAATAVAPDADYRITLEPDGRHYFHRESDAMRAGQPVRIAVSEDIELAYDGWRKLVLVVLVAFPFALALSVAGGWVLAGRALAPVAAMARTAREITAERLSARLPVDDPDDELGHLAQVFNDTLQRLDDAFARLRRFTADASHELRTPLTVIRSVGENALAQRPDAAQHADAIGSILEETDRLARLLDGLLLLTRAEAGEMPLRREQVDLLALAQHVAASLQVLAEEKQQSLVVEGAGPIGTVADGTTLRQAVFNLVANAIRYTPEHGRIVLRAARLQDGGAVLEVQDDGPGIAAEHHARIFERFYRIDPGRARDSGGTGLGLAIAKWTVELNRGRLELASAPGHGSVFRICLPAATAGASEFGMALQKQAP
jgi:heavy metal sensor kinase